MCEYCKENENNKIAEIHVVFHRNNPLSYGYPEIANWEDASFPISPSLWKKSAKIYRRNLTFEGLGKEKEVL